LTDAELSKLCPQKADKERLAQLMNIVKEATSENEKRQNIINNISNFASVIVKILVKVI
jgi:cation transport ATPase